MHADVPAQSGHEPLYHLDRRSPRPHTRISPPTPRPARGAPPAPDSPARPQVRSLATGATRATCDPQPAAVGARSGEPPPRSRRTTKDVSPDEPVLRPRVTSVAPAPMVIRVPAAALTLAPAPAKAHQVPALSRRSPRLVSRWPSCIPVCSHCPRSGQSASLSDGSRTIAARGTAGPGDPCHHRPDRGPRRGPRPPRSRSQSASRPLRSSRIILPHEEGSAMSNHLAIATVTAALAQLVHDATERGPRLGRPARPAGSPGGRRGPGARPAVPLPGQPQHRAAQRRPARTECGR